MTRTIDDTWLDDDQRATARGDAIGSWCARVRVASLATVVGLFAAQALAQSPAPATPDAATSTGAQSAGEFKASDTRILSDPFFLPRAGEAYGLSAFTFDRPSGTNLKAGAETGTFTASDNAFNQTLAYGLTDRFTIRAAIGYASDSRDSTAAATGDVTVGNSSGFNDPTVSATYRVLDESGTPLILDLTASYSPNAFAAQSSGGGLAGTVARGGQNTGFSVALGRVMPAFTLAGTVGTTYVGQQTTELLSNSTSSQSAGHWSYDVGVNTQTRFTARVSLNAGVSYSTAGNYGVSNLQNGNAHTYDAPATAAVTLAFNYHLVPNRVVGSVSYEYDTLSEATNLFANAKADTAVSNRTGNVVGVRFAYLFN